MTTDIIPTALQRGDTIAFISPSGRLNDIFPASITRSKALFSTLGFTVKEIFTTPLSPIFPESIQQRCSEIHAAFSDPSIKAIVCTVGGTQSNELVRHLNFGLIKENPKIFVGYSDITVLHYAIYKETGLRTFYGPCAVTEFGEWPTADQFTINHFLNVLTKEGSSGVGRVPRSLKWTQEPLDFFVGKDASKQRKMEDTPPWRWIRHGKGKVEGPIFGGCLHVVLRMKGTKWWPEDNHKGKILFLENSMGEKEDEPIPVQRTRSFMADLGNLGLWEEIAGLVIGRPYAYDEGMREEFGRMVVDQCYGTEFPILLDVDVGHTSPMLTLPLGAKVRLDAENDEFSILEEGVRR